MDKGVSDLGCAGAASVGKSSIFIASAEVDDFQHSEAASTEINVAED